MDYLYSELNKQVEKVEYVGAETSTAKVTVGYDESLRRDAIAVDVKAIVPSTLAAQVPTLDGKYFTMIVKDPAGTHFELDGDLPEDIKANLVAKDHFAELLEAGDNIALEPQESGKVKITAATVPGVARFTTSAVSSLLPGGQVLLLRANMASGPADLGAGDTAIFPDKNNLVLFVGNITGPGDDTQIIVDDVRYLRNTIIDKGEWTQGTANYPESYTYKGYRWVCLGAETSSDPAEGGEWLCLGPTKLLATHYALDPVEDQGGVGASYSISKSAITPADLITNTGDTIIFSSNEGVYVGQISGVSDDSVTAEVKMAAITEPVIPHTHHIKITKQEEVGENTYTVYFTLTNARADAYNDNTTALAQDMIQDFLYPAVSAPINETTTAIGIKRVSETKFHLIVTNSNQEVILAPLTGGEIVDTVTPQQ